MEDRPSPVLFEPFAPGFGVEWLENTFIPQSLVFYSQILPIVWHCGIATQKAELAICDIGAGSGVGTNLLHNFCNNMLGLKVRFSAFDLERRYKPYANH